MGNWSFTLYKLLSDLCIKRAFINSKISIVFTLLPVEVPSIQILDTVLIKWVKSFNQLETYSNGFLANIESIA